MTTGTKAIERMTHRSLILVVALTAAGCLEIDPPNKPPTASIEVELGGDAVVNWTSSPATSVIPGATSTPLSATRR